MLINQKDFAIICQVSPPSISIMIARGKLDTIGLKIDTEDQKTIEYFRKHNGKDALIEDALVSINPARPSSKSCDTKNRKNRKQRWERNKAEYNKEYYNRDRALSLARRYFNGLGISISDVPDVVFQSKLLQIKLKHAIKEQRKQSHKEVTNG